MSRPTRAAAGFTLLEMVAVVLLMGIVVTASTTFYIQLSRESNRAANGTRVARRSTAVLDRIARELEGSVLVKKPEALDPLDHPWLFLGEREGGGEGSDRLKFVTRSHRPRSSGRHESDLAVVAYNLREDADGGMQLLRWSSPRLPEGLDRTVPADERDGAQVLVEDVAAFGVRFLNEEGRWQETWDSSSVVDSSKLPRAAEIQLALAAPEGEEAFEPEPLRRQVVLPLRPLDFEALLTSAAAAARGEEEQEEESAPDDEEGATTVGRREDGTECVTVAQCISANPDVGAALEASGLPPSVLTAVGGQCASDYQDVAPLPPDCL